MSIFDEQTLAIFLKLVLAAALGIFIGFERWQRGKAAGMRTFSLVSLGSALFTILSVEGFQNLNFGVIDPARLAANVILGIGFLGAGMIFLKNGSIQGLTTAAGIWVSAGLGMAIALDFYSVAIFTTVLVLLIFRALRGLESRLPDLKE